jgi:16S rRNA (guanine966-N2)-methyltransferase
MSKPLTTTIIAGTLRGRKLKLPAGQTVRPTRKQVIEAGFSILNSRVHWPDVHFLDLCCGSGQWGLEAVSRGAGRVTMVDTDTSAAQENITHLGADVALIPTDLRQLNLTSPADVIVADPPYESDLYTALLHRQDWGRPGTLWLLETPATTNLTIPNGLTQLKTYIYGKSALHLLLHP